MRAIIKETEQEVEVVSRFMPKKRNAPGRAWVCVLNDGRIVDEDALEYVEDKLVHTDVPEAAKSYADEQLAGHNRELAESGHTRHFKMGYVCFAGYEIEAAFADGMLAERERLMKEAHEGMIERDCGGQVMLDVPDVWEHGEYTLLNPRKYPDMKPGERRRVKVLIVENE